MRVLARAGLACLAAAAAAAQASASSAEAGSSNVFGEALVKCDRPAYYERNPEQRDNGYPNTGYFRDNRCTASEIDAGAHFVCVKMPNATTASGEVYSSFWTETGQARSPEQATTWPKPGPWCICMWAFARMRSQHAHFVDMLECGATHQWVVEKYQLHDPLQGHALHALCSKCGVETKASVAGLRDKCRKAREKYAPDTPAPVSTAGRQLRETCDSSRPETCVGQEETP